MVGLEGKMVHKVNTFLNVFSEEELNILRNLPEVLNAKEEIDAVTSGSVSFSVPITPLLQNALETLGVRLSDQSVPMRWIKGDTAPHTDSGSSSFELTHLVYLTESPGEFQIGETVYPIHQGTAYIFSKRIQQQTKNPGS